MIQALKDEERKRKAALKDVAVQLPIVIPQTPKLKV